MDDQTFEVNLIENLTSEHSDKLELEAECEFELKSEDFKMDQIVDYTLNGASSLISLNPEQQT